LPVIGFLNSGARESLALVSLIGGLLLGYQWGQPADASIVKALPASLEMMQLLRDEHRLIANICGRLDRC
jgi:hypothetical protein